MTSQFRTTSPPDAAAITAFLERVFEMEPGLPVVDPRQLQWKCWEERPDWPGSRGYVMTAETGIVAHACAVPLSLRCEDRRLRVVRLIDWAADPKAVGSGAILMKRVGRLADAVMAVGGSEITQKILPVLGFKVCGQATSFVRPLRPLRRLAGQKLTWRLGAQFARSALWSWQAPRVRAPGWEARRIAPDELASVDIPWPKPGPGSAVFERTPGLMRYYLRCPAAPMEFYAVAKQGRLRGYFLLAAAPAQARIADLWVDSADRADWEALVHLAVRQAGRNRAFAEVVSVASDAVTRQSLLACGFHARGSEPMCLLACGGSALPSGPIRYQMIDSDAAYMHRGRNEFWA